MPVQIDHVQASLDVRPAQSGVAPVAGTLASGANGIDRAALEGLRPIVLLILREELDRLRRQQG
jgi:hypothetical protein